MDEDNSQTTVAEFPHPWMLLPWPERQQRGDYDPPPPRLRNELRMIALSAAIRAKPGWSRKCKDPEIVAKWRAEALEQEFDEKKLTPALHTNCAIHSMIEYVMDELHDYAKLVDEATGIEVSCVDGTWHSDRLIPDSLLNELVRNVYALEDMSEEAKDWHPGSEDLVLDLVHPSLFCLAYGSTHVRHVSEGGKTSLKMTEPPSDPQDAPAREYFEPNRPYIDPAMSRLHQWLPTDVQIQQDGEGNFTAKFLDYINNLHPKEHATLYDTLERVLARFVPLWERVLGDLLWHEEPPSRVPDGYSIRDDEPKRPPWSEWGQRHDDPAIKKKFDDHYAARKEWAKNCLILPDANPYVPGHRIAPHRTRHCTLANRTLQIITKLANIHLEPSEGPNAVAGKEKYHGGSWHVEGMRNEHIVATGIYYYDQENITESKLAFRMLVGEPGGSIDADGGEADQLDQDDPYNIMLQRFGIGPWKECNQYLSATSTSQNRCIAFPNVYQHQVSPFELVDKTKPGFRKILVFFLVDPNIRILSTTDVPPQQADWIKPVILNEPLPKFDRLPTELREMIFNEMVGDGTSHLKSWERACQIRLELMDERGKLKPEIDREAFSRTWNLCEH